MTLVKRGDGMLVEHISGPSQIPRTHSIWIGSELTPHTWSAHKTSSCWKNGSKRVSRHKR